MSVAITTDTITDTKLRRNWARVKLSNVHCTENKKWLFHIDYLIVNVIGRGDFGPAQYVERPALELTGLRRAVLRTVQSRTRAELAAGGAARAAHRRAGRARIEYGVRPG